MKGILTREQIDYFYNRNIDLRNRVIYFGPWQPNEQIMGDETIDNYEWTVNDYSAQNLIKSLYILENAKKAPIEIIWSSHGGYWEAGIAIFDFIKQMKSPVTIKSYGRIRSMGALILQAAKYRWLSSNCYFMIHYGTSGIETKHDKDAIREARHLQKCDEIMESILLQRIKEKHKRFTLDRLREYMVYDKYLSPREAVAVGLADKVMRTV